MLQQFKHQILCRQKQKTLLEAQEQYANTLLAGMPNINDPKIAAKYSKFGKQDSVTDYANSLLS